VIIQVINSVGISRQQSRSGIVPVKELSNCPQNIAFV